MPHDISLTSDERTVHPPNSFAVNAAVPSPVTVDENGITYKSADMPSAAECLIKYAAETLQGTISMEEYGNPLGARRVVVSK